MRGLLLKQRLLELYSRLYLTRRPVHIAESDAERDGIYRLRYEVYAQEQNAQRLLSRYPDGAIETEEDHAENAILFYLGPSSRPQATGRAMLYRPGEIPQQLYDKYSLHRFPDIHDRAVFEVNFFAARKDQRGGAAILEYGTMGEMARTCAANRSARRENIKRLHTAGATLLAGSDSPFFGIWPGSSLHNELAERVRSGVPPA